LEIIKTILHCRVFWEEDDLRRITKYCEKDVLATINLFMKYKRMDLISEEKTSTATDFEAI